MFATVVGGVGGPPAGRCRRSIGAARSTRWRRSTEYPMTGGRFVVASRAEAGHIAMLAVEVVTASPRPAPRRMTWRRRSARVRPARRRLAG